MSRVDFNSLIKYFDDNLDNKDCKTKVNGVVNDLDKAKSFLLKIGTEKIRKNEACDLYNSLIKSSVAALKNVLGRGKSKRKNILDVLNNIKSSLFDGIYLHYKDVPKKQYLKEVSQGDQN